MIEVEAVEMATTLAETMAVKMAVMNEDGGDDTDCDANSGDDNDDCDDSDGE